ncbi:MAG: M3 family oligoendopeptidase [Trueperaceae bacterium]
MKSSPHWSLTTIFQSVESPEFTKARRKLERDVAKLETYLNANDVRAGKKLPMTPRKVQLLETLLHRFNRLGTEFRTLSGYLSLVTSTNAFDEKAQAERSSLSALSAKVSVLDMRLTAWLGRSALKEVMRGSRAQAHRYSLEKRKKYSHHLMGEEAEELFGNLRASSSVAWANLYDNLVSRATINRKVEGKARDYTIAELKSLNSNKDGKIRKAAFAAERELLEQHALSFAASLNSIKGQVNEVSKKRGWESGLEQALFINSTSAKSLAAMQAACQESFPMFRRYLKSKAKLMGKDKLPWYDLFAPLSVGKVKTYTWPEAQAFILEHFESYSPKLAAFAKRTFEENWHDVPPRKGKTGGAFCMSVPGRKESRLLHNFTGSLDDVFTLAHELGHAYHNECMYEAKRTMMQCATPMTLAETASIFCETLVVNALLDKANEREKLVLLEQDLQGATQLVVDIYSRFILEKTVFDKRRERELSVDELKATMLDAQQQTYGNVLENYHDLMWAQKGHYYIAGLDFYNFPYTFGYLFALGLYAEYKRQPQGFQKRYDTLLSSTGLADARTLAKDFGIDIESQAFWQGSLNVAAGRVLEFERLVNKLKKVNKLKRAGS